MYTCMQAAKWKEGEALAHAMETHPASDPRVSRVISEQRNELNKLLKHEEKMIKDVSESCMSCLTTTGGPHTMYVCAQQASSEASNIDKAGLTLNRWYNAHEHQGSKQVSFLCAWCHC